MRPLVHINTPAGCLIVMDRFPEPYPTLAAKRRRQMFHENTTPTLVLGNDIFETMLTRAQSEGVNTTVLHILKFIRAEANDRSDSLEERLMTMPRLARVSEQQAKF